MQWLQHVIAGPREALGVQTAEEYRDWARRTRVRIGLPATLLEAATPVPAHVSDGRWCVDCPCGSAGLASPEWGFGICVDCGTVLPATFPKNRAAVEEVLLARPSPQQRHYFPHAETAAKRGLKPSSLTDEQRQNRANGHPVKRGEG